VKPYDADFGALRKNFICDLEHSYIVDSILIKGLSVDREQNDFNFDYTLESMENGGIKLYQHKFFQGFSNVYVLKAIESHLKEIEAIYNE
jgi:hypothetical protein